MNLVRLVAVEELLAPVSSRVNTDTYTSEPRILKTELALNRCCRLGETDFEVFCREKTSATEHIDFDVILDPILSVRPGGHTRAEADHNHCTRHPLPHEHSS